MDNLTPATVWAGVLAVASAVVLLSNALEKIVKAIKAARAPHEEFSSRLDAVEKHLDEVDNYLKVDKRRLDVMDEGNRATQRALLALLDHGIDGNNIKQMQDAKEALQQHLINR